MAGLGLMLRPECADDRPFLADLYASTRMEELAQTGWPETAKRDFLDQQFTAQHAHYMRHYPGAEWLIVEREEAAIGRLYFAHWTRECRIIDIAFIPDARNKGFGSAVLGDLVDRVGEKIVSIHVERMNPALSLYRRLGFEIAEDKGVYLLLERRP
jgi:ribosomal protein S18 acetylase RimI-like enzyme